MKKFPLLILLLTCLFKINSYADNYDKYFVTTKWLNDHLNDDNLIILFVGQKEQYDKEHIPGAQFAQREKLSTPREDGKLSLEMPSVDQMKSAFEEMGISNHSKVIIYFEDWVTPATRLYFTFDYLGLDDNVFILDGGFPLWKSEGRPITNKIPVVKKGSLKVNPNKEIIVKVDWVEKNLDNAEVQIIDARDKDFYTGKNDADGHYKKAGHIKGATSLPFSEIISENSPYKIKEENILRNLFKNAGVNENKTVVTYCHIGQQATLVYLAAKYLGYKAKMYDGSYQEWNKLDDLPYEGSGRE